MRAILTWHSVDPSGSPISVTRDQFRRQMEWLGSGAVQVVGVEQLLALPDEANAVALTFDDGIVNFETEAAPLLRAHGFPATLFVVTGRVGLDSRWESGRRAQAVPVFALLDWDALGQLREVGISVGAHTKTHPRLPELGEIALEEELASAAEEIARRLGDRPAGLAYPYGAVDERVARLAASHYQWACTTELRTLDGRDSLMRLPRIDAWYLRGPLGLAPWGSRRFRSWIWGRGQGRRIRGH